MPALREAVRSGRAASIVGVRGMGGVGKTEIAIQLCNEIEREFPGRVIWVDTNDRLFDAQQSIATAVGLNLRDESDRQRRADLLRSAVREHDIRLIVLDNVRRELATDLDHCKPSPPCALLVTSRLELPLPGGMFPLDVMTPPEALDLLRGEPGLASFVESQPADADHICVLCARHPLALRLAASRLRRHLRRGAPLKEFTVKMEDLAEPGHEGPAYSLKANFDLSYDDLPAAHRLRWRKLAVFAASGFSMAAAAAVWGMDSGEAVNEAIDALLDASMLETVGPGRFRLHDLLHQYAAARLREANEDEAARRAHAEYLIALFDKHYTDDPSTAPHVALEIENLKEAANWAADSRNGELLARLATTPHNWLSVIFNVPAEWRGWLTNALRLGIQDQNLKANCIQSLGDVHTRLSELPEARARYEEALPLYRAIGAKLGEANTLAAMGRLKVGQGEVEGAERDLAQVLAMRRAISDLYGEGADLVNFAIALLQTGHKAKAKEYALRAKPIFERIELRHAVELIDRVIAAASE